ncbi:MAG: GNAT family N-acetyltransferase [Gammaproteobacteria bacterium]|nr:GNAT family N-acetyltransferase [Gammaproteobacteria bacterium]
MNTAYTVVECSMRDGTPFRLQLCVEPGTAHSPEFLKGQIADALQRLSAQSRWMRFAAPVNELTDSQLDYLTDLDNHDRVAWCASTLRDDAEIGIGLGRYVVLADPPGLAEFALTVVDAYQGQGVGLALLRTLVESAGDNGIARLRGYVLKGNRRMLALCRHVGGRLTSADASTFVVDIDVPSTR